MMGFMKEIEQLVQNYADAVHSQDEKAFKDLWTGEPYGIAGLETQVLRKDG